MEIPSSTTIAMDYGHGEIKKQRTRLRHGCPEWRWHLDEVFVKINGQTHYLWRAVNYGDEVLEAVATKRRDRRMDGGSGTTRP